ncbi:MAG: hypothetical protein KGP14_13370 [Betaproteobacteria bacterium]|nr:hypothetical protein [Betaproteobacteria bacterium]
MADSQFIIDDGNAGNICIDIFGDGDYEIEVRGETIHFDWSDRFGPIPLGKRGREIDLGPGHKFWRAVSLWKLQGKQLEGNRAIWHEPKKPVLQHLGGRNYLVIEDGEPGYDW